MGGQVRACWSCSLEQRAEDLSLQPPRAHDLCDQAYCSGSIHCAIIRLLQSLATELYSPLRNPPLTLITIEGRPLFIPLALHSSPFSCACPCAHEPTSAGFMSTGGLEPGSSNTKCSSSIHYAIKGLLQILAAELYNPLRYPPLTLTTAVNRPRFNPLALH